MLKLITEMKMKKYYFLFCQTRLNWCASGLICRIFLFVGILIMYTLLFVNFGSPYLTIVNESNFSACKQKPICPVIPKALKGRLTIEMNVSQEMVEEWNHAVIPGGYYDPTECQSRNKLAIIVPFRNRHSHILPFVNHMHQLLQRQQLNYKIYIVEQTDNELFNRAKLLNVGFTVALKEMDFDCFAFHDIDLLPDDDRHLYRCSLMPRHMNYLASNNDYRPMNSKNPGFYFGGVSLMSLEHVIAVNGWSNKYWGWGGEDDDMRMRLYLKSLSVWRYPDELARYTMMPHDKPVVNQKRYENVRKFIQTFEKDGLNSLKYKLISRENLPYYTLIKADLSL